MHKDKRFSIATRGLWSRRHDLKTVLNAKVQFRPLAIPHATDGYLGWGDKPSSVRTLKIADKIGKAGLFDLKMGSSKAGALAHSSPSVSYVVDDIGIYYNAHKPSLLENIITTESLLTSDILERSRTCINEIVEAKLSKYNDSPVIDLSQLDIGNKKYILLVDQVMGDQSITGAMSNSDTFLDMLKYASTNHPDCEIVIKAHPASNRQDGHF